MTIRFDDRVAIVTGAGGGLGRSHAMLLAERGAKVVVNDLGGSVDGTGGSESAADRVVEEIKAAGGTAVASYDSVADPDGAQNMVRVAVDAFGKLDILINNAGILRDRSLAKIDFADIDAVIQVHLLGSFYATKAAWPHMMENNYGRVVLTSSTSGLCGNFGQSNYGAAKSGMVGMMNCLFREGVKYNILINTVAPAAYTRMTEGIMPEERGKRYRPEVVSPLYAYLCSEQCTVTDQVFATASGSFHRVDYYINDGAAFDPDETISVDMVANAFDRISGMSGIKPLGDSLIPHIEADMERLGKSV